eukprot:6247669-Prymnesium_polylepis.1
MSFEFFVEIRNLQPSGSTWCRSFSASAAQGSEHRSLDSTDVNPTATVRVPAAHAAGASWSCRARAGASSTLD